MGLSSAKAVADHHRSPHGREIVNTGRYDECPHILR
jgi:hypothetical protein